MHSSISFFTTCLFISLIVLQSVQANTEKVIFTVSHSNPSSTPETQPILIKYRDTLDLSKWKKLSSPYTNIRSEKLLPSFYENDVTIAALLEQLSSQDLIQDSPKYALFKEIKDGLDLQHRAFNWYILEDLEDGASFELRISYQSTTPADFDMKVWTLEEAQLHLPKDIQLADHFPKTAMFARVKATYTGVSYQSDGITGPETLPVPYNLVLERLYFMIPYQALKLAVAIAVVVIGGIGYLVPIIHRGLKRIASEGNTKSGKTKKA